MCWDCRCTPYVYSKRKPVWKKMCRAFSILHVTLAEFSAKLFSFELKLTHRFKRNAPEHIWLWTTAALVCHAEQRNNWCIVAPACSACQSWVQQSCERWEVWFFVLFCFYHCSFLVKALRHLSLVFVFIFIADQISTALPNLFLGTVTEIVILFLMC